MTLKPTLSICVLHYQNNKLTSECMDSIDQQELPCHAEKIIVDNGSCTPFYTSRKDWKVKRFEKNNGNIGGQNRCFQVAKTNKVLFVSNDVTLMPDCIFSLVTCLSIDYGQYMPKVFKPNGDIDSYGIEWKWPGYGMNKKVSTSPSICPSIIYLMRKDLWESVGGFDENLISSHEDIDMGLLLSKMGYRQELCHIAKAIHIGNATLKDTLAKPKEVFRNARKRVIKKHYSGWDRAVRLFVLKTIGGI